MRLFSGRLLKNLKLCLLSVPLDIIINAIHFILLFIWLLISSNEMMGTETSFSMRQVSIQRFQLSQLDTFTEYADLISHLQQVILPTLYLTNGDFSRERPYGFIHIYQLRADPRPSECNVTCSSSPNCRALEDIIYSEACNPGPSQDPIFPTLLNTNDPDCLETNCGEFQLETSSYSLRQSFRGEVYMFD